MAKTFWDFDIETMTLSQSQKFEGPLIAEQIRRVYEKSDYYGKKFDIAGIDPQSIDSYASLATLPFTEKSDIVEQQQSGKLFGTNQCAPFEDIVRVVGTGGSSGTPTRLAWTKADIESYSEMGARALWAMGCRPDDMVINCFNYSIYAGGVMDHGSFEHLGAAILPYGVGQSMRLLNLLAALPQRDCGYALYSTPSYAIRLADLANDNEIDLAKLNIKKGFFSGEPGLQVKDYRQKIETAWGMQAMDLYGAAEVGVQSGECEHRTGLHYCGTGHVAAELIHSESGEVMEMRDGAIGELVFTTLRREACPLIRLRTHDTVKIYTDPCRCGRGGIRFHVLGRNDDMFIVKGVNVFPLSIQEVLLSQRPDVTGEFFIVLDCPPPIDYAPLIVLEVADQTTPVDYSSLVEKLIRTIALHSGFTPTINLVKQGSIASEHKTKRLYRQYEGTQPPGFEILS